MRKLLLVPAFALMAGVAMAEGLPGVSDGPGPNLVIEVADASGASKGTITLDLYADKAPNHVARLVELAKAGAYDGIVFHRVIDGFMAQTGDVQHGKQGGDTALAGMGGSDLPDLAAEFSDVSFQQGTVGMARSQDPNSANSQFFIMFDEGAFLNGQYTVVGRVTDGMDVVDAIKRGKGRNGEVIGQPDVMKKVTVTE